MNNVGDLNKVWEIKALKRKPAEEEARKILERVAKQVQPIMRKHKWRVKVLSEMCPKNPALLGLNVGRGLNVRLRLRRANRDWDFIPFDQVLDTMLHELCHNAHGPHNANFYKLWDELRKECEELMTKGVSGTGEGFDLPGRRLGGFSRQPPLSSLRQTALSAAEKRVRMGSLLGSGPKRLGGDSSIMVALSPIQAAAMAAERRYQDDIWCGSESCEVDEEGENSTDLTQENAVPQKRSRESSTDQLPQPFNDCIGSSSSDLTGVTSVSGSTHDALSKKRNRQADKKSSRQSCDDHPKPTFIDLSTEAATFGYACNQGAKANTEESTMWECVTCTLLNPPLAPLCELCGTQKPKEVEDKYKMWGCKFCTLENGVKLEKCIACGQWRYSHGPPVAAPPPNLGT